MSYVDFSSWPRDQEQTFVVFEQRAAESQKKAWMIAGIISAFFFVFMVGIYAGVTPEHNDVAKSMDMSNLTKKDSDKKDAPKAAPAAAPAAAPTEPAPAAPAETAPAAAPETK